MSYLLTIATGFSMASMALAPADEAQPKAIAEHIECKVDTEAFVSITPEGVGFIHGSIPEFTLSIPYPPPERIAWRVFPPTAGTIELRGDASAQVAFHPDREYVSMKSDDVVVTASYLDKRVRLPFTFMCWGTCGAFDERFRALFQGAHDEALAAIAGLDATGRTEGGLSPIAVIVRYSSRPQGEKLDEIRACLAKGMSVDAAKQGWTALHYAAMGLDRGMVDALLGLGARRDIRDSNGMTALEVARQFDPTFQFAP